MANDRVTENLHASAVAFAGRAALIRGPSGSGKSDLALRCLGLAPGGLLAAPFQLVADDRVIVQPTSAGLRVSGPPAIKGLLEVRGVGIFRVPALESAIVSLVVDLVPPEKIVRLPETRYVTICGVVMPALDLAPFEVSAPLKLVMAMQQEGIIDGAGRR